MDEPRDLVDVAVTIAREAGKLLMQDLAVGRFGGEVEAKSSRELVSRVDRASESLIRQLVAEVAPDHEVLGEEQGLEGDSDASHRWIVDPLDGTTNYLHGHPFFAVSIGVEARDAGLVAAVVHAPCLGETFFAAKGDGAYLNTRAIRLSVSGAERLDDALLATGFAYDRAKYPNEQRFLRMLAAARGIRRCGSAALDLAYVAAGRYDGFWELGLRPWDVAAGALLVLEAGGRVSDLSGGEDWLAGGGVVAAGPTLHGLIAERVAEP